MYGLSKNGMSKEDIRQYHILEKSLWKLKQMLTNQRKREKVKIKIFTFFICNANIPKKIEITKKVTPIFIVFNDSTSSLRPLNNIDSCKNNLNTIGVTTTLQSCSLSFHTSQTTKCKPLTISSYNNCEITTK